MDIAQLKNAVGLADVIEQTTPLTPAGSRYRHGLQHDSLVVDTSQNTYWWNSRGGSGDGKPEHGDIIDWIGRHTLGYGDAWASADPALFKEAACTLARLAGQPDLQFKPEDPAARQARLSKDKLLQMAADYYRALFADSKPAWQYARSRGWADLAIQQAALGYSDGKLIEHLPEADLPLAIKLGLIIEKDGRRFDAIAKNCLVYVHQVRGKIAYLAGRTITGDKRHYNIAAPKETYWAVPHGYGKDLVIVEGQADAVTIAYEWGVAAIALCGLNLAAFDVDALRLFKNIYIATDGDAAGRANLDDLAGAIGPLTRILRLPAEFGPEGDQKPAKDANDLLKLGFTAEAFRQTLTAAETYISHIIDRCATAKDADYEAELQRLFSLTAKLEPFNLTIYRAKIVDKLNLSRLDFDRFLTIAKYNGKEYESFSKGEQYTTADGWTIVKKRDQSGAAVLVPLSNASFKIVELISHDNGSGELYQEYEITGEMWNGKKLPPVTVPTADFDRMGWVAEQYPHVIVEAGRSTKDLLRTAIQHLSKDFPRRIIYEHTGWREINGTPCYLTTSGALGLNSHSDTIQVDMRAGRPQTNLQRYDLPLEPQNIVPACLASLSYWNITDYTTTVPQWAAAYLAPLMPLLPADFGLWVHGKSGSFKSVLAALVQSHFGDWTGRDGKDSLPGNFISTTNSILMDAFMTKDILFTIDDFAPGNTPREMRERDEVASKLLRSLGNKAARGRMLDGRRYQASYPPRCLALITAEDVPPGQSTLARAIGVRVVTAPEGSPERAKLMERLSRAQTDDAPLYRHAMSAYIQWIARHWTELQAQLPAVVAEHAKAIKAVGHARLASAFAKLMAAVDTALFFMQDAGAITRLEAEERHAIAWKALQLIMQEHAGQINALDPALVFTECLRENLDAYDWYMEPANPSDQPYCTTNIEASGRRDDGSYVHLLPRSSQLVGWYDAKYIYLLPKVVKQVMDSYSRSGTPFPVGRNTLYLRMQEKGWIETAPGASTQTVFIPRIETSPRVLKILKSTVYPEGQQ